MAAGEQMFGNIMLGSRGGAVSLPPPLPLPVPSAPTGGHRKQTTMSLACVQTAGSLKVSDSGLVWKRSGGGRTLEVAANGALLVRCTKPGPASLMPPEHSLGGAGPG